MSLVDFFKGLFGPAKRTEEEERLLEAIVANPDDDAPRLAYADHLASLGNPFGEFVRVDVEHEALPEGDPRRDELGERWGELMYKHGKKWVKPLKELELQPIVLGHVIPSDWFERGLIEKVTIDKRGVIPGKADRLFEIAPTIRRIHFERCSPMYDGIAGCEYMSRVIALDLSGVKLEPADLQTLVGSPHFANLRELNLEEKTPGDRYVEIVAASPHVKSLRKLGLRYCNCGPDGARKIAESEAFANLVEIDLHRNGIGDEGAAALAGSPHLANLEVLVLEDNEIGPEGVKALASSPHLAKLRTLNLESCHIGADGARAIAAAAFAPSLESLNLARCEIGDEGLLALFESPVLDGLKELSTSGDEAVGDAAVKALAEAGDRCSLRELNLSWAAAGPESLVALVNSSACRELRKLDLSHTKYDAGVLEALATSPHLDRVAELMLYGDDDDLIESHRAKLVERFGDDALYA